MKPKDLEQLFHRSATEMPWATQVIGAVAITTTLVGITAADKMESAGTATPVVSESIQLDAALVAANWQAHQHHQQELAQRVTNTTPLGVYSVALTQTHGNLIRANAFLLQRAFPPLQPATINQLRRQLHFKPATQLEVSQLKLAYVTWENNLSEARVRRSPAHSSALKLMYQSLSTKDRKAARGRILQVFYSEYNKNVHEELDPLTSRGCNCGNDIDVYTDGHAEAWCEDFASWVYKEAAIPLSGGQQYGRPDWQLPRVHTYKKRPDQISGQAWFQNNGSYFPASNYEPEVGDFAFLKFPNALGQVDDDHAQWHVMLVLKSLKNNKVLLGGGNTGNAIATRTVSLTSSTLVGFGSPFKP